MCVCVCGDHGSVLAVDHCIYVCETFTESIAYFHPFAEDSGGGFVITVRVSEVCCSV